MRDRDRDIHHKIQLLGAQLNLILRLVEGARRETDFACRVHALDDIEVVARAARTEYQDLVEDAEAQRRRGRFKALNGGLLGALSLGFTVMTRGMRDNAIAATTTGLVAAAAAGTILIAPRPYTEPAIAEPSSTATATQAPAQPSRIGTTLSPEATLSANRTAPEGSPSPLAQTSTSPTALPSASPSATPPPDVSHVTPNQQDRGRGTAETPPSGPVEDEGQRNTGDDEGASEDDGSGGRPAADQAPGNGDGGGRPGLLPVCTGQLLVVGDVCVP